MTVSQIAGLLEISKSYLYGLVKAHPKEVPTSREDLEQWAQFVARYRIEPPGFRMPRMPSAPRAPRG